MSRTAAKLGPRYQQSSEVSTPLSSAPTPTLPVSSYPPSWIPSRSPVLPASIASKWRGSWGNLVGDISLLCSPAKLCGPTAQSWASLAETINQLWAHQRRLAFLWHWLCFQIHLKEAGPLISRTLSQKAQLPAVWGHPPAHNLHLSHLVRKWGGMGLLCFLALGKQISS